MLFYQAHNPSSLRKAIILINFGTPASPSRSDVRTFLLELFKDKVPSLIQQFLVRTCLIPCRLNKVVTQYRSIWTDEGSPLLVHTKKCASKLSSSLPEDTAVAIAMQYGMPSIAQALDELKSLSIEEIIIFPLFPQQVPSITQSIYSSIFTHLHQWPHLPRLTFIPEFYKEPWYIQASAARLLEASPEHYDHVVFSFHAIPERGSASHVSYKNQCVNCALSIAKEAQLNDANISISFQSQVGYSKWTTPTTHEVLNHLLRQGKKRILVICPSFMVDCMETLGEIAGEYRADFLGKGGDFLGLAECLNDFHPLVEGMTAFFKPFVTPYLQRDKPFNDVLTCKEEAIRS